MSKRHWTYHKYRWAVYKVGIHGEIYWCAAFQEGVMAMLFAQWRIDQGAKKMQVVDIDEDVVTMFERPQPKPKPNWNEAWPNGVIIT